MDDPIILTNKNTFQLTKQMHLVTRICNKWTALRRGKRIISIKDMHVFQMRFYPETVITKERNVFIYGRASR